MFYRNCNKSNFVWPLYLYNEYTSFQTKKKIFALKEGEKVSSTYSYPFSIQKMLRVCSDEEYLQFELVRNIMISLDPWIEQN